MQVWLVTIGEPVPVREGQADRLHRSGCFARFLARSGHDVVWWTSTFDHFRKKHWFEDDMVVRDEDRLTIRLLRGSGYRGNFSLARFVDHAQLARRFARLAGQSRPPDVIVAALPTIELCRESVRFGLRHRVPVVLDMRDMWPDIFIDHAPRVAKPLARLLLEPMFRQTGWACANATAIIGITDAFVDWGLRHGRRSRSSLDKAFPLGYSAAPPGEAALREAGRFWDSQGISAAPAELVACFFGAMGRQLDLRHILEAARLLEAAGAPIRFILCGAGERLAEYRRLAHGLRHVHLPGWVDAARIHVLMRRSGVGLDPMPARYDFLATINNKAIEYLSAGLPVISSPARGVLFELLAAEQCGMSYEPGDARGLADLLNRLHRNRMARARLAGNAERLFLTRFRSEVVHEAMRRHLERVVALPVAA